MTFQLYLAPDAPELLPCPFCGASPGTGEHPGADVCARAGGVPGLRRTYVLRDSAGCDGTDTDSDTTVER